MSSTPFDFDRNCGEVVAVLLRVYNHRQSVLETVLHMNHASVSRALNGHRHWRMDELSALAEFFEVPISVFFDTPEALIRSRCHYGGEQAERDDMPLAALELV